MGIAALVAALAHWGVVNAPKWATALGLMAAPERGPRPVSGEVADVLTIESVLRSPRGPAEGLGEKAFYLAVLLIALALIRRILYRLFAKTHTLIAVAYLVLVFHSVVLMEFDAWTQPVRVVTALLLVGGTGAAVLALTRQIGRRLRRLGRHVRTGAIHQRRRSASRSGRRPELPRLPAGQPCRGRPRQPAGCRGGRGRWRTLCAGGVPAQL
ncbi:hypothetical protein [Maliponia aquimaris]|uniref:hypothetical protein n=1 Tax=Maliponia aquimaris TaxID=1673631 RepID=UPI00351FB756